jgi:hypothetical protein
MKLPALTFMLGLCATTSVAQWTNAGGPSGAGLGALAADSLGHVYASVDSQWYRSSNSGLSWETIQRSTVDWKGGRFCIGHDNVVIVGTGAGVWRSTTFGSAWTTHAINDTAITALGVGADGNLYAGVAPALPPTTWKTGVWRSVDNAMKWNKSSPFWQPHTIEAVAVTPQGTMFVALISHITTAGYVVRSTNGGTWWDTVYQCGRDTMLHALAVGPDGSIFAGTTSTDYGNGPGGRAMRSTDNGQTWTFLENGLPQAPVWAFDFPSTGEMVLGSSGAFASTDNGESWRPVSTGLEHTMVYSLAHTATHLIAGTYKNGVWWLPLSEVTAVDEASVQTPDRPRLSQNYPNPFNPGTTIEFSVVKAGFVALAVYDILGREVADLVHEYKAPGMYTVRFDASGLAGGAYICRTTTGGFTTSRTMLLLR